jgi:hypothetical protein
MQEFERENLIPTAEITTDNLIKFPSNGEVAATDRNLRDIGVFAKSFEEVFPCAFFNKDLA